MGRRFRNTLIGLFKKPSSGGKSNNALVAQDNITQTRLNPSTGGLSMDLYPCNSPRNSSVNAGSIPNPLPQISEDLKGNDEGDMTRKCLMVNKEDLVATLSTSDKAQNNKNKTTFI